MPPAYTRICTAAMNSASSSRNKAPTPTNDTTIQITDRTKLRLAIMATAPPRMIAEMM